MKKILRSFSQNHVMLSLLCCLSLSTATLAANSRCAYIFHNPEKPEALHKLARKHS